MLGRLGGFEIEEFRDRETAAEVVPAPLLAAPVRVPYELIVLHDHGLVIGTSAPAMKGIPRDSP